MSSKMLTTLDLEDLTPRQLRMLLRGAAQNSLPRNKRAKEDIDEEDDEDDKENDDLVDLHREKGDSKPPKVQKDDLPKSLGEDDDEEEKVASKKDTK